MNSTTRSNFAIAASSVAAVVPSPLAVRRTPRRQRWFVRLMLALKESRRRAAQREIAAYSHLTAYAEAMDREAMAKKVGLPFRGR